MLESKFSIGILGGKKAIPVGFRFDRVVLWLLTLGDLFPVVCSYPDQRVQTEGAYDIDASVHTERPVSTRVFP